MAGSLFLLLRSSKAKLERECGAAELRLRLADNPVTCGPEGWDDTGNPDVTFESKISLALAGHTIGLLMAPSTVGVEPSEKKCM